MIRLYFFRNYIGLDFFNLVFKVDVYEFKRFRGYMYVVFLFICMVRIEVVIRVEVCYIYVVM